MHTYDTLKSLTQFASGLSPRDARNKVCNDADAQVVKATAEVVSPVTRLQGVLQFRVVPVHRDQQVAIRHFDNK